MGLMKQAYDTYCALEKKYAGAYSPELKEPLVPVSHQIVNADIKITLDTEGILKDASLMDKDNSAIIIPVTEQSAGRTGETSCSHPLCDQIRFLTPRYPEKYEAYLTQLHNWENSEYSHPKLGPIARYVEGGTILEDLARYGLISLNENGLPTKEKQVVCWQIESGIPNDTAECWKDRSLFQAFISYYESLQSREKAFCMVSGEYAIPASQHPKKIITAGGNANAKLISANDTSGFTYRGRFTDDKQAMTMSYDASQRIHNVLHWLAATQGVLLGNRFFLCWNPQGIALPKPHTTVLQRSAAKQVKYSDYRKALYESLCGWKEHLPEDAGAVVAAFDAATSGRLSVTYYSELLASDFLERLHHWDAVCCWWNGSSTPQSPWLKSIVDCAYGVQREQKGVTRFVTDDRVLGQQMQRLIACRVDCARMPADILHRLVDRASNPTAYDSGLWRELLFVTCAVIQKYYAPILKEDLCMEWQLDRRDPSFQYGRLLAVMERAEADYYSKTGENRQTNAMKSLSAFKKTPLRVFERVNEKLESAYLSRLDNRSRNRYYRLRDEIMSILCECSDDLNAPLNEFYLVGYSLQRNAFFTKSNPDEYVSTEEENEEE